MKLPPIPFVSVSVFEMMNSSTKLCLLKPRASMKLTSEVAGCLQHHCINALLPLAAWQFIGCGTRLQTDDAERRQQQEAAHAERTHQAASSGRVSSSSTQEEVERIRRREMALLLMQVWRCDEA